MVSKPVLCCPMNLEQLRKMEKPTPVWLESETIEGRDGYWCLCNGGVILTPGRVIMYANKMDGAKFYACPPAYIDRELREPCNVCNGEKTLYQHTNTTKLFMDTFGNAATLVTECVACPPYADCCMKNVPENSAFRINFCPECGRPLTVKAWDEWGKRLRRCME